jgi:hypothetical protein
MITYKKGIPEGIILTKYTGINGKIHLNGTKASSPSI